MIFEFKTSKFQQNEVTTQHDFKIACTWPRISHHRDATHRVILLERVNRHRIGNGFDHSAHFGGNENGVRSQLERELRALHKTRYKTLFYSRAAYNKN